MEEKGKTARELVSAILISAATLAQGCVSHQANLLTGEMTAAYQAANATRALAMEQLTKAVQLRAVDVQLFAEFSQSYSAGNKMGAQFLLERFRPSAKAAVEAWIAMRPLKNPNAPQTPFALKEYTIEEEQRAKNLMRQTDEFSTKASALNAKQNQVSLLSVLFISVLFFCGIATNFELHLIRYVFIMIGFLIFVGTTIKMFLLR